MVQPDSATSRPLVISSPSDETTEEPAAKRARACVKEEEEEANRDVIVPPDTVSSSPPSLDLFDFEEERKKTGVGYLKKIATLQARAKANKYFYSSKECFYAALELYNRQPASLRPCTRDNSLVMVEMICRSYGKRIPPQTEIMEYWTPRNFKRQHLTGHGNKHKHPCEQCHDEFGMLDNIEREEFFFHHVHSSSSLYMAKTCTGCMGRTLMANVGDNLREIRPKLEALRKEQEDHSKVHIFPLRMEFYEDEYLERKSMERENERWAERLNKTVEEIRKILEENGGEKYPDEHNPTWWKRGPPEE